MDKKICSGIVTFNPNIELLFKVVDAVASQVIHIIIFDNNSDNIGEIDEVCKKFSCKLLRSKENKGIASYNKGLAFKGKSVFMGEDSFISDAYLIKAELAYKVALKILKKSSTES